MLLLSDKPCGTPSSINGEPSMRKVAQADSGTSSSGRVRNESQGVA